MIPDLKVVWKDALRSLEHRYPIQLSVDIGCDPQRVALESQLLEGDSSQVPGEIITRVEPVYE